MSIVVFLPDEAATVRAGQQLAQAIKAEGGVITLQGDLGAGKTTLVRSLVQAMGHDGRVVSPTYTLMEPYELAGRTVYHLDLYRLADPEELAYLGVRDIDTARDLMLIEWPEQGGVATPPADLALFLSDADDGEGRVLRLQAQTEQAQRWLICLDTQG